MENGIEMDDVGVPPFQETSILRYNEIWEGSKNGSTLALAASRQASQRRFISSTINSSEPQRNGALSYLINNAVEITNQY